jgi:hypothetical protein
MVRKMSLKITLFLAVRGWPPKIPCYFHRPLLPKVMLFSLILFGWPLKIQNHRKLGIFSTRSRSPPLSLTRPIGQSCCRPHPIDPSLRCRPDAVGRPPRRRCLGCHQHLADAYTRPMYSLSPTPPRVGASLTPSPSRTSSAPTALLNAADPGQPPQCRRPQPPPRCHRSRLLCSTQLPRRRCP